MATFDQRNQTVSYQYNAAGDINISGVTNRGQLLNQLECFQAELQRAKKSDPTQEGAVTDAEHQLSRAIGEARKPMPDQGKVTSYLESASKLIGGVTALGGLVVAIQKAVALVGKFL